MMKMKHPSRRHVLACAGAAGLLTAPVAGHTQALLHREVSALLATSAQAWSAGNLDAFMAAYEDAPQTRYLSHGRDVQGFAAIRAMYASRFGGQAGQLGQLSFDVLEVRALGDDHALMVGRYRLRPPQADQVDQAGQATRPEATGLFSLVLGRTPAGWRIVLDHSS